MRQLIARDFLFSRKHFILAVCLSMVFPILYAIEPTNSFYLVVSVLGTIAPVLVFVSKVCQLEDNDYTVSFLAALPYKRSVTIFSRYGTCLLAITSALLINILTSLAVGFVVSISSIAIATGVNLTYFSLYLLLLYTSGYGVAQHTTTIFMVMFAVLLTIVRRAGIDVSYLFEGGLGSALVFLPLVGVVLFVTSAYLSKATRVTRHIKA